MARRMFSSDIVGSDAFLEMPSSSRELYFQLGVYADDDGFVQPKKVMRIVGAKEDDLRILLAKKFVLSFASGVIVIKHWRINNYIRKQIYSATKFTKEKTLLFIRENGAYTFNPIGAKPLPNNHFTVKDTTVDTASTLSRPSIGKDRIDKIYKAKPSKKALSQTNPENTTPFNFKEKMSKMKEDGMKEGGDKRMIIVAYYWFYKKWEFENEAQYRSALKRELRPAGELIGYTIHQVSKAMEYCDNKYENIKWTLETVIKVIAESVNKKQQ